MTTENKITKATFKSFIRKNTGKLFVNVKGSFDGMTDSVESLHGGFAPAEMRESFNENTLGVCGVWLVNGSRDYFSQYNENGFEGIKVYNCCGSFIVAVKAA